LDAGWSSLAAQFTRKPNAAGFYIKTGSFPIVTIDAYFKDKRIVQVDYSYQRRDLSDTLKRSEFFDFSVDHNDKVYLQHNGEFVSVEDATLLILTLIKKRVDFRPPANAKTEH
jgi:hypothetical protein